MAMHVPRLELMSHGLHNRCNQDVSYAPYPSPHAFPFCAAVWVGAPVYVNVWVGWTDGACTQAYWCEILLDSRFEELMKAPWIFGVILVT